MASARFSARFSSPSTLPDTSVGVPRVRTVLSRLADLYVDSLEAADYATFLLDLLWKVTGGHPDGATSSF